MRTAKQKAAYSKSWRKRNPEKATQTRFKNKIQRLYGLSVDAYEHMLAAQNGACALCGGRLKRGRESAIDHDHQTGKVRAILCRKCNLGLGHFNDNAALLRLAASYIAFHQE